MKIIKNIEANNITVYENINTININSGNLNTGNLTTTNLQINTIGTNNITYTQLVNGLENISRNAINGITTYINHKYQEYRLGGLLIQNNNLGSEFNGVSAFPNVIRNRYNDISDITEINAFNGSIDIVPINNSTYISGINTLVIDIEDGLIGVNNYYNDTFFKFKNKIYSQSLIFRTPYDTTVNTGNNPFIIAINIGNFNSKTVQLNGNNISPNTNVNIVKFTIPSLSPKQIGLKIDFCININNSILAINTVIVGIP